MYYGRILTQTAVSDLMRDCARYTFTFDGNRLPDLAAGDTGLINQSLIGREAEFYTFRPRAEVEQILVARGLSTSNLERRPMTLEDAFIGLTGKY